MESELGTGGLLFVTWDGPNQPYLNSLFIPSLVPLLGVQGRLTVLQYCWGEQPPLPTEFAGTVRLVRRRVARRFGPLAVGAHVVQGALDVIRLNQPDQTVLVRSYIPAAMALTAQRLNPKLRFAWDLDGFMPDERVEFGGWSREGPLYRAFRGVERRATEAADVSIVRTNRAREVLLSRGAVRPERIRVIGNGRDERRFFPQSAFERDTVRRELGIPPDAFVVGYVGSVGPQYRPKQMVSMVRTILSTTPNAFFLLMSGMRAEGTELVASIGASSQTRFASAPPTEMGRFISAMDVGLALRDPLPSQAGVSPLKIGEYLLCGVPVIATRGVGGTDELAGSDAIRLISEDEGLGPWLSRVRGERESLRVRARELGLAHFSMKAAIAGYTAALAR